MDCIFQRTKIDNRYIKKNNEISSSKHVEWRKNTERVITKAKGGTAGEGVTQK